ncbi:MAG TPA: carbohydrate kinase family protein [Candidatus Altiarchaeales archaeon]|nr:carbohydrate kinase family protein [Candidatus Altiarchaeales archaeon]
MLKMKLDIIGFGALNLDRLYRVERIAREGEHSPIKEFYEFPGGSAANTIAGLAKLGVKAGFIGAVGDDKEGKFLLNEFKKFGVDIGGIDILNGHTGIIIGFVDDKGERTLYPYPGVNDLVEFRKEYSRYLENTKYLHLSSFVNDKQFDVQKRLVESLPKNIIISFCPSDLYARRGMDELLPIIERGSIIFLNETEIREITGEGYRGGSTILIENGADTVVVTLGKGGCYIKNSDSEYRINAFHTRVVDTTGAGDAFNAGFLYGIINGKSLEESGRIGNWIASKCIEKFGARAGLPRKIEI